MARSQDDLAPGQAGERRRAGRAVGLGLAAPDGRDRVGDPVADRAHVERVAVGADHAEVVDEDVAVVAGRRSRREPAPPRRR